MNGRRILALVLAALLGLGSAAAEETEKYDALPEIFQVSVEGETRALGEKQAYVYKEHLITTNEQVNAEIAQIVDAWDEEHAATLQLGRKNKAKYESTLDTVVTWYRTGEYYISTLIESRANYKFDQLYVTMTTRTYDLQTGDRILLTDLFPEDSEAWDILSDGVREQITALYPDEERDEAAIEELAGREALEKADFTLSGMELTLHYPTDKVFPGKVNLMRVRFFYPQFEGMMSETGVAATDNSRWKMVAITCDDGPKDFASSYALDAFRKVGARVTYFICGKQLAKYDYLFMKQCDQNMIFGCHTFNHWSGYSYKKASSRLKEIELMAAETLRVVGERPRYFRAPGGTYPPWIEAGLSIPLIQWSLDTKDFTGKQPKAIAESITSKIVEGDIVLVHDTGKYEHKAVPIYGEWLTNHGYMMVTLDELAAAWDMTPEANVLYFTFRPGETHD